MISMIALVCSGEKLRLRKGWVLAHDMLWFIVRGSFFLKSPAITVAETKFNSCSSVKHSTN